MASDQPTLKVTLVKSGIGRPGTQRRTLTGLGLKKLHHSVVLMDTPAIRGMIRKVQHLLAVERVLPGTGKPSTREARRQQRNGKS